MEQWLIDLDVERRRRLNREPLDVVRQVRREDMLSPAERDALPEWARQATAFALVAFRRSRPR